jgi:hypothetical protein
VRSGVVTGGGARGPCNVGGDPAVRDSQLVLGIFYCQVTF